MQIIQEYFLLFIIYSFLGWCIETILISIQNQKFVNRGFLLGPWCPIYGMGSLVIISFLGKTFTNPIILFFMIIVICGILEYLTSWIMEVIFKARWWDYSKKKFNLNGRVCLVNLLEFGTLGLLVNYILNPFFLNLISKLSFSVRNWSTIILSVIYILDTIISFIIIFGFRKITKQVNKEGKADNTQQITQMVKELFAQKSFLHRRFINAYPRLEAIKIKIEKIKEKIEEVTNDAKDAVNEKKEELKDSIEQNKRKARASIYLEKKHIKSNFKGKIKRK